MASSKARPGIHDRRVDPETGLLPERPQCIKLTRKGARCARKAIGRSKLCKTHMMLAQSAKLQREGLTAEEAAAQIGLKANTIGADGGHGPSPEPSDLAKAGLTTTVVKASKSRMSTFVITEQSRLALQRLGQPADSSLDPKIVLLDTVNAAWRQRQVWEQMLASIPEEDWEHIGKVPIPGVLSSAKGARIEVIQKFLLEATKVAARTSKLAIDAGIEERLVRLAEEQSALIADTVRAGILAGIGALSRLGLITPESERAAIEAATSSAAHHLRALAAGLDDGEATASPDVYEGAAVDVTHA